MSESDSSLPTRDATDQVRLAELADDFVRRYRAGERPDIDEYARAHGDLAHDIRDLFPAMLAMEQPGLVATMESPLPIAEGAGTVIGRYKLLERIGEGGFGIVYMAEQQHPVRRKVALKVIKPGLDTKQVIARFEAERQALALMDHENIAKVFDAGATHTGRPYFVMELVHGVPITEYCDKNQLRPRERLELFIHVCRAVQHAHTKGVIHRDIKPTNVLVTLQEGVGVPKVIDFGVAKATGPQLTERTLFTNFAQMLGTPLYMSPEQAEMTALDVDTRSDVYSLGVLLYELLTGTTPFDGHRLRVAAFEEVRRIIREEEPPRPSTRISTLGARLIAVSAHCSTDPKRLGQIMRGDLDWIVMKAMEKARNRRYETAIALARDVERYLHDEPVEACPPSAAYRLRKFARRHKAAVVATVAATAALLLAVAGLAVSNVLITRERNQKIISEGVANEQRRQAQANLNDALAAVDQMLTRVSEDRLASVPQMEPVRRELLQDALGFYQKFLATRGDDPAVRRETALAYRRIGSLHFQLGDYGKSESAYRTGFAMLDALDAQTPLEPDVRADLVSSYIGFSWVLRNQGKLDEGEQWIRRGVATAEQLHARFPDTSAYRDRLAAASNRLAEVLAQTEPVEAERIARRLVASDEASISPRDRARAYESLGIALVKQQRLADAEAAHRQGVVLFEQALAASPSVRASQVELAQALRELAMVVDATGRPQEAEEIYRRAIPIHDRVAADFPAGPHDRWGQARMRFQYASVLLRLNRMAEAEQAYRQAVELSDKLAADFPMLPGYQSTALDRRRILAEFLAKIGRREEAVEIAEAASGTLDKLAPKDRQRALYIRGHGYAQFGEWDKAAADFAKAIDAGSDDVLGLWYPLAVLHLRAGRIGEYRALCERLLAQLGDAENHYVVIVCKLAPGAVADLSRPVRIAQRLADHEPKNAEHVGLLGAALYRAGDMKAAIPTLESSIQLGPDDLGAHWRRLTLAMAYGRSGRLAEGQKLLQEASQSIDDSAALSEEGPSQRPMLSWAHRIDLTLLRREAEQALKMPATTQASDVNDPTQP